MGRLPIPRAGAAGRGAATLVGALLALAGTGVADGTAQGACPDASGVTVVVDFRDLGGPPLVRCAPGPVEDGFDALRRAGIDVAQPARFPGMVCRIEGRPADDPCRGAPPADAYWSYWHATGEDWTYSQQGPAARTPPPGSAEGWSFATTSDVQGSPPRPPPPIRTAKAPATAVPPTSPSPDVPTATASPTAAGPTDPSGEPPPTTATPTAAPTGTPSATAAPAPTVPPSPTPRAPATSASTRPGGAATGEPDPAAAGATPRPSAGPPVGTVAVVVVIAVLALAAAWSARRRDTT